MTTASIVDQGPSSSLLAILINTPTTLTASGITMRAQLCLTPSRILWKCAQYPDIRHSYTQQLQSTKLSRLYKIKKYIKIKPCLSRTPYYLYSSGLGWYPSSFQTRKLLNISLIHHQNLWPSPGATQNVVGRCVFFQNGHAAPTQSFKCEAKARTGEEGWDGWSQFCVPLCIAEACLMNNFHICQAYVGAPSVFLLELQLSDSISAVPSTS